jgi:hypothetical protein
MTRARLTSVLSMAMVTLGVAAAILNYLNNGRITWKAVAALLCFVSLALVVRNAGTGSKR